MSRWRKSLLQLAAVVLCGICAGGVALSAPELILIVFLPALLRQFARTRLEGLLKAAAGLADALGEER